MPATGDTYSFQQIHIEVARNATDDFNPFHDKHRWQNVEGNPFGGPIALGFQLECLVEEHVRQHRIENDELALIAEQELHFSCYEFKFASAVKAHQPITVAIKDSRFKAGENPSLANRVAMHADGNLAIAGYKRETRDPLYLPDLDIAALGDLRKAQDRDFLPGSDLFLKRKFMTTSNAKNFLSGSLVEQATYIDEIDNRVQFPEIFPCSLLSSALLERASQEGHDFERQPMVYKSHSISLDRRLLGELRSNDALHLLSRRLETTGPIQNYECYGVIESDRVLFRARIDLVPLATG